MKPPLVTELFSQSVRNAGNEIANDLFVQLQVRVASNNHQTEEMSNAVKSCAALRLSTMVEVDTGISKKRKTMEECVYDSALLDLVRDSISKKIPTLGKSRDDMGIKCAVAAVLNGPGMQNISAAELERKLGVPAKYTMKVRALMGSDFEEIIREKDLDPRKTRKDKVPDFVKKQVEEIWLSEDASRASPNMKDVYKEYVRKGRKNVVVWSEGARFMTASKEDIYVMFLTKYPQYNRNHKDWKALNKDGPGIHIGYTAFCNLMPRHIKGEWKGRNVCACEHHTTMQSLIGGYSRWVAQKHSNCECGPDCRACSGGREEGTDGGCRCGIFKERSTTKWVHKFTCDVGGKGRSEEDGRNESQVGSSVASCPGDEEEDGEEDLEDLPMYGRVLDGDDGDPDGPPVIAHVNTSAELGVCSVLKKACVEMTCKEPGCGIEANFRMCKEDEKSTDKIAWTCYEMQRVEDPMVRILNATGVAFANVFGI